MSMDDGNYLNTIVSNDSTTEAGEIFQDATSNQNPTLDPGSPPVQDLFNITDAPEFSLLFPGDILDSQGIDPIDVAFGPEVKSAADEWVQERSYPPCSLDGEAQTQTQEQIIPQTVRDLEVLKPSKELDVQKTISRVLEPTMLPQRGSRPKSVSGFKGVYTRRGIRGYLVNITPPNWKGARQWRTFETAREASYARDAVEFYRGQDFKYNNPELEGTFPRLPSHLRLDSIDDLQEITKFVQKQSHEAACRAKDRGERGGSSSLGTSSLGATSTEQRILRGEGKAKRPREPDWIAKETKALSILKEEGVSRELKGKVLWDFISQRLEKEHGFFRCSKECERQWGTLLKRLDSVEEDLELQKIDPRDTIAWGRYWKNSGEQSSKNKLLKVFSLDCYDRMNRIHQKRPRKQTRGKKKQSGPPASRFAAEVKHLRNIEGRQSDINEEVVKTSKEEVKLQESKLKLDILEYGGKQGSSQTDNPENLGR